MLVGRDPDEAEAVRAGAAEQTCREISEVGGDKQRFRPALVGFERAVERGELDQARRHRNRGLLAKEQRRDPLLDNRAEREQHAWVVFAHGATPVPAAVTDGIAAVVLAPSRRRSILPTLFASASSVASEGCGSATVTGTVAEA